MNTIRPFPVLFTALLLALAAALPASAADKTRLLIISGGHDFETNQFFQMFKDDPDVTFEAFTHPKAHAQLRPDAAKNYDVIASM